MDIKIAGSGTISTGEYDEVKVSGASRAEGLIRCKSMRCAGSFSGKSDIECEGDVHASGAFENKGSLKAGSLSTSGSFCNAGDVTADSLSSSGSFEAVGSVKASEIRASGSATIRGSIEAENASFSGRLVCGGLINAGELHIRLASSRESKAASIGGGVITVEREHEGFWARRAFTLGAERFTVAESIEGDEIKLSYTHAKTVCGRNVTIGRGCRIDLVQYSGEADISPDAKVGRVEKL